MTVFLVIDFKSPSKTKSNQKPPPNEMDNNFSHFIHSELYGILFFVSVRIFLLFSEGISLFFFNIHIQEKCLLINLY